MDGIPIVERLKILGYTSDCKGLWSAHIELTVLAAGHGLDVPSLEKRREAAAIGLTCRLMSGNMKQPLKPLTPKMRNPNADKPRRSSRLKGPIQQHEHQLQEQTTIRSMVVLKRSYRG